MLCSALHPDFRGLATRCGRWTSYHHWKGECPVPQPRSEVMKNMMVRLRGMNRMWLWCEAWVECLLCCFALSVR